MKDDAMQLTKRGQLIMIIWNFNAKITNVTRGDYVGAYGLGTRNRRGNRLVQFFIDQPFDRYYYFQTTPQTHLYMEIL